MEASEKFIYGQEILKYDSQSIDLEEEEITAITDQLDIRLFKKGEVLLREKEIPDLCYFLIKGCVRQYFVVEGEERTTEIFTEGQPILVFTGMHQPSPSACFLSCIEDSVLSVGPVKSELADSNARFSGVCELAAGDELVRTQEALQLFRLKSHEERYLHLLTNRPHLLDRVPQYILASYLGIQPESLSRIRKRITLKDKTV